MKIINDTDFYKTKILATDNNLRVRFQPVKVSGKGWSVEMVTGSRKIGRFTERALGFENFENYSRAQAQMAAENLYYDTFRFLKNE